MCIYKLTMFDYIYKQGKTSVYVTVKLDGKKVGNIKRVLDGWAYFPLGQQESGLTFPSIREVQKSLEFPDEV